MSMLARHHALRPPEEAFGIACECASMPLVTMAAEFGSESAEPSQASHLTPQATQNEDFHGLPGFRSLDDAPRGLAMLQTGPAHRWVQASLEPSYIELFQANTGFFGTNDGQIDEYSYKNHGKLRERLDWSQNGPANRFERMGSDPENEVVLQHASAEAVRE